jgi:hypothetical protein
MDDISTRTGFKKLGIEKVGALVTRGVMIDVAGQRLQGRRAGAFSAMFDPSLRSRTGSLASF